MPYPDEIRLTVPWLDDKVPVVFRIKGPLIPSISPEFYSATGRGGPLTWYQSRCLGFNPPRAHIFRCTNYSTLTSEKSIRWGSTEYAHGSSVRPQLACNRRNVGLRIKTSSPLLYHLGFIVRLVEGPSNCTQSFESARLHIIIWPEQDSNGLGKRVTKKCLDIAIGTKNLVRKDLIFNQI
jgi:hypothetical protein